MLDAGDEQEAKVVSDDDGNSFRLVPIECPICRADRTRVVGLRGGPYHRYRKGVVTRIVQCERCRLMYANPFPFPLDSQRLYGDPEKYFAHQNSAEKVDRYRSLIREGRDILGRELTSVLDVGSGRGELLKAAALENVEDVIGLELSDAAADYAAQMYGVTVRRQTVEQFASSTSQQFDLVTLNAVLEHVFDPDAMLAAVYKLTRPDAIVYIDVPNEPHLMSRLMAAVNTLRHNPGVINLSPTFPPYHVFGFNETAMSQLLTKHGFRICKLDIRSSTRFATDGTVKDKLKSAAARALQHVANATGTASNMFLWARRL